MNYKFPNSISPTNPPCVAGHSCHANGTRTCTAIGLLLLTAACATLQAADLEIITPIDARVSSAYTPPNDEPLHDGKFLLEWFVNPDGQRTQPSFSEGSKNDPSLTALWKADAYGSYTWMTASGNVAGAWVILDLEKAYDLADAYIWQRGQGGDGYDLSDRDANEILIEGSNNGQDWQVLTADPIVDLTRSAFSGNSGAPKEAQIFKLSKNNKGIKFVRITINSNYGNPEFTGLAEVRFTGLPSK